MTQSVNRKNSAKTVTVGVLLVIIVFSGFFILKNYLLFTHKQPKDKPPRLTKLKQNFQFINQDEKFESINQLKGKVWLATPIVTDQPEKSKIALNMMKSMEKVYASANVELVAITLNSKVDIPPKLKQFSQNQGLNSLRWHFWAAGGKKLRAYLKNQMRLGLFSYSITQEGKEVWEFPSMIALFDRDLHLRGRYDFAEARKVGEADFKALKQHLQQSIDYLLKEK